MLTSAHEWLADIHDNGVSGTDQTIPLVKQIKVSAE
jgi:hypothetical protein